MNEQLSLFEEEVVKIPVEFLGEERAKTNYTSSNPREWTEKEIEWCKNLKAQGYNNEYIAQSVGRTAVSIQIKLKRLGKKNNTYNKNHIIEKYQLNNDFLKIINPKTVLDLYCGEKNFYSSYDNTTNDINENIPADYHGDSLKIICKLFAENKKYDLIDLDPFGSAFDCFDLAIKMAKKGLVITLGEMGHKRWKRLDYVGSHYGINTLEDYTSENLVKVIQQIGLRNKKKLEVYKLVDWQNISRVYFVISEYKVIEK